MDGRVRLVGTGAAWALAVALPAALLAQVADAATGGDGPSPLVYPCAVLVLAGMAVGGWAVGRTRPAHAGRLGALAGVTAVVVVLVLGIVRQVVAGHGIAWASLPGLLLVAAALGAAGTVLPARWPGRTRP